MGIKYPIAVRQGGNLEASQNIPIINQIYHQAYHSSGLGKLVLKGRDIGLRQPVGAEGHQDHYSPLDKISGGEANGTTQKGIPADPKRIRDKLNLQRKQS